MIQNRRRMMWVGDAACDSGFSRATHYILDVMRQYWEVHVLALNYLGDPHPDARKYPMYPAYVGGDAFGNARIRHLATEIKPDFVLIQNDPWNIPAYVTELKDTETRIIAAVAVDGKNCNGKALEGMFLTIFWTEFGRTEAQLGGYTGPAAVIPLGVDLGIYKPVDKAEARRAIGLPRPYVDGFIVGNVNRNQHRKRIDLTIQYFAEWVNSRELDDAYLYLHVAPTGDQGFNCQQLAEYYGVGKLLILAEPGVFHGLQEERLNLSYNCFDVQVSTAQGEGWGLTTMEGMACGIPQIVPNWAALGEWPIGAAVQVPCPTTAVTPNFINAIGGIVDKETFISELDAMYRNQDRREFFRKKGLELVARPEYRWENIGMRFAEEVTKHIYDYGDEEVVNG